MKKEISLTDLVKLMLKKIRLIVVLTLIFAMAMFFFSSFVAKPKYVSDTKLYVRNIKDGSLTQNDINLSRYLLNAYIEVLLGNKVMDAVAQELNQLKDLPGYEYLKPEGYSRGYIKSTVKATPENETEVITINVTSTSAKEAKLINEKLFEHLKGQVNEIINAGEPRQIYEPTEPTSPSSPNITKNTILGALVGFLLALCIIVFLYMLDTTIHDENNLTEEFSDITMLGVIPVILSKDAQVYSSTNTKKRKEGGKQ